MKLTVTWRSPARRELRRLDPPAQRRVIAAVERFAETGEGDIRRLTDVSPPQNRLRGHFNGCETFGIRVVTPRIFLDEIGETS